jgi:hypothetical protein
MTPEQQQQLRAAFRKAQIGKLPKPTKKENAKGNCTVCGGYHGLPAVHLDYVGHAAVTERILEVDPDYEFGPVLDINKRPIKSEDGSVLYYLSIAGSTKYEWGDGPNMKEVSSDAIRRCAMRFGVALDLWAKEPLNADQDVEPTVAPKKAARAKGNASPTPSAAPHTNHSKRIMVAAKAADVDDALRYRLTRMFSGVTSSKDVPADKVSAVVAALNWYQQHPESISELEKWEENNGVVAA